MSASFDPAALPTSYPIRREGSSVVAQWRALKAVVLREFRTQYGKQRLGVMWAFVQPIVQILAIAVVFGLMGRMAPIGNAVPFYAMGVLNVYFFSQTETFVRGAFSGGSSLLAFSRVRPLDLYLSRFIVRSTVMICVFTLVMGFLVTIRQIEPPSHALWLLCPLALNLLFGLSVGIVNAQIIAFYPGWKDIYAGLFRLVYFTSGIFYLSSEMPAQVQRFLYFNPFLHDSEWMRTAWYYHYQSSLLDVEYPIFMACTFLLLSLMLERALRKSMQALD